MDNIVLGGIVKRLYPSFSMQEFNNRLRIQKMIFLMRAFNLDLGYHFNLYLRGPYCPNLTRDAYEVSDWNVVPLMKFNDPDQEVQFTKFISSIASHKDDLEWLEIGSTLLMLKELHKDLPESELIRKCHNIKNGISEERIKQVLESMNVGGFL
jgi:uncharacterized protein YwgA